MKTEKCNKCGKAGHYARDCQTDMSSVKCFKCGERGHIGANCPKKGPSPKVNAKARPKGKGSKGKGKGKGKKGKLNAVGEGEEDETGEEYWYEEENEAEGESFPMSGVLMPLMLSAVETDDTWQWWLLDSGASVSVLAEHFQQYYRCKFDEGGALQQAEYRAANGSAVKMSSQNVTVYVAFEVFDCWSGKGRTTQFPIGACVGGVSHNILSTTFVVKRGWSVVLSPGDSYLWHEESGTLIIAGIRMWGGWLHAKRTSLSKRLALKDRMDVESPGDVSYPEAMDIGAVRAVHTNLSSEERKQQHVLRGHYPFDPNCLECQQGRGVRRSSRRPARERLLEVQADFFFLGETRDKVKFLLFRHVFTGMLGVTLVHEDVQVTARHIREVFAEFGLVGNPLDVRSDAAHDVGALIRRATLDREFTIDRAAPQEHDTVGSVERGVREVKEAMSVISLELEKVGLSVRRTAVAFEALAKYVTAMHNLHGKVATSGKTAKGSASRPGGNEPEGVCHVLCKDLG